VTAERRIEQLKERMARLGPLHPGSISQQFNVCGKAHCRCKDRQLSYVVSGRSTSRFLKREEVGEVRRRIKRYQSLKKWMAELVQASVEMARKRGFPAEG
jgi:hypothetical protein